MLLGSKVTLSAHLFPLQLVLDNTESTLQQFSLFLRMHIFQSRCYTATGIASSEHDVLVIVMLGLV